MNLFPNSHIDFYAKNPRKIPRPKPMKVLVLGLSRTGTATIYTALQTLGMNPYHFKEVNRNKHNGHFEFWLQVVRAKYQGVGEPMKGPDFDQVLWNYDAVTDAPGCLFVEELVEAYPEAKVILTTRTPESWLESIRSTLLELVSWRSWVIRALFDRDFSAGYWTLFDSTMAVWSRNLPPWKPSSYPTLLDSFEKHNTLVRKVVPKDKLLDFHPTMGWAPLCAFLGVPTPEGKFPHVNDGKYFLRHHTSLYWSRWFYVGQTVFVLLGLVVAFVVGAKQLW
ncbi:P-loop containing nucleoside triphosphate hydrolase protein [Xylaria sp. FL0043]|nr:P-loop containing nucleoside triphosphate hydrolase protein [Xylaria sp. FL0043]